MKKIVSLFQRNYDGDRLVRDEVVPGAEWVQAGEGVATRKYDGTCCMVKGGVLYKRYDVKKGREKPFGFIPAQDPDPVTGHWPGWVEVGNANEDRWYREAAPGKWPFVEAPDGTYELLGPKVQGNPEGFEHHILMRHGVSPLPSPDDPRTYDAIKEYLRPGHIEGIVWHHPDGRMVKIKAKDFGFKRRGSEGHKDVTSPNFGVNIIGIRDVAPQDVATWLTPEREKEFLAVFSRFMSDEGDKAVLGKIGGAWDGRWILWHQDQ